MEIMSKVLATVALAGFAIQQILEMFDPWVSSAISKYVKRRQNTVSGDSLSQAEIKKWFMAVLAFLLGAATVGITKISLLVFVESTWKGGVGDFLVSALVLGAGTEGLNTLTKYFGYVKDGRRTSLAPAVEVSIIPSSTTVKVCDTFQFRSVVKNSQNTAVTWEVSHGAGESIDETGKYTAPKAAGMYQVVAISQADTAKHAISIVKVIGSGVKEAL